MGKREDMWSYRQELRASRRQDELNTIEEFVKSGKAKIYSLRRGPKYPDRGWVERLIESKGHRYTTSSGHTMNLYSLLHIPKRLRGDIAYQKYTGRYHVTEKKDRLPSYLRHKY